jgi:hypothetical protein
MGPPLVDSCYTQHSTLNTPHVTLNTQHFSPVLILLCVLTLLCVCPHTTFYVSSYYSVPVGKGGAQLGTEDHRRNSQRTTAVCPFRRPRCESSKPADTYIVVSRTHIVESGHIYSSVYSSGGMPLPPTTL